jgi:hypothetical protein
MVSHKVAGEHGPGFLFDTTGMVCLAVGLIVVALHAHAKFAETTIRREQGDGDYIAQFLPRYLATREEYARAQIGYLMSMAAILVALSIIGPPLFTALAPDLAVRYNPVAPLIVALILVGVLPNLPWLAGIEWQVRRFWHERAYIPKGTRAAADTLRACGFDFSAYRLAAVLAGADMRGVELSDFAAPRGSVEYGWARLSCLSHELSRRRNAEELAPLDAELIDRYASDLDAIVAMRRAMAPDIAEYRRQRAADPAYENDRLRAALTSVLRRLYILLGCAVRVRLRRSEDANATFRSFGFDLPADAPPPGHQDLIIVGLSVMTGALLALCFAAVGAAALADGLDLWRPSRLFPRDGLAPFIWATSTALVHGAAIMAADLTRARRIRHGRWFAATAGGRAINIANYIRVGLVCALTGEMVLFVWSLLFHPSSVALALATLPFALLPAATGAFYVWHLDNAELRTRPSRPREIGLQAGVTALCGLFGTMAWLTAAGDVSRSADFLVLVTLCGAVIGASLAWYLAGAAANRRRDPEADARDARIASLRTAALAHFGAEEPAEAWLAQPQPALRDRAPREAAADVDLYVTALGLLQRPERMAA